MNIQKLEKRIESEILNLLETYARGRIHSKPGAVNFSYLSNDEAREICRDFENDLNNRFEKISITINAGLNK